MGDHHGAAWEVLQRVFQGGQGFHVQVVGGLVQQDQVAALLEGERQVQAVPLTTRKDFRGFLLVGALESEGGQVGAGRHFVLAHHNVVQAVGHDFPHGFFRVNVFPALVHVGQPHGLAHIYFTGVGFFQANNGFEQGGFAHTVGADHPDNAVAGQGERQVFDEGAAVEPLVEVVDFHHLGAQARRGGDLDFFEVQLAVFLRLGGHFFVAGQAGLGLGLAGLRPGPHPLQLLLQTFLQLAVFLAGDL